MARDEAQAKRIEAVAHHLAQQLQVIEMTVGALERRDGARSASLVEPARRALRELDLGLEELVGFARGT